MGRTGGFTLIELVVVLGTASVILLVAWPNTARWREAEAARSSARVLAGAFAYAQGQSVRTGHNHMVFFLQDTESNPLVAAGQTVPVLVLDDGLPGSTNQNCEIDAGEPVQGFRLEDGVSFGVSGPTGKAPDDQGGGAHTTGRTFAQSWVLFLPDGTPRAVTAACAEGVLGSGGGGLYLGNAARELAVVLTPLGGTRLHTWNSGGSSWD